MTTLMDYPGWRFAVEERVNPPETRLHVWRDTSDGRVVITGFDDRGNPDIERVTEGQQSPFNGFKIPRELGLAIAAGAAERPDHEREMAVLRESLDVERSRVDRFLVERAAGARRQRLPIVAP